MKTTSAYLTLITLALALAIPAGAQDAPKPAAPAAAPTSDTLAAPAAKPKVQVATKAASAAPKETQLRLNFRGAPLDMVLNYLSEAAGFIIVLETSVKGTIDVWSNTPLTKAEAIELLNSALNKNGYAALQNGRTLTIVTKDDAKRRDVPVKSGNDPMLIPKDEQIVTQIIPVRYINAAQALKDLAPVMPTTSTITANEAGNSIVMTDTQTNIRRVTEIISALDNAVAGVAQIKVFPLKYADAKTLSETIKELFSGGSSSRDPRSAIANAIASRFGGGGGPPGFPGGGGDTGGGSRSRSGSGGGSASAKLVATADEYSNSVIVSAPDEMMTSVEKLVEEIDKPVEDVSELRVFHLKNADPIETADLLSQLFPDPNASNSRNSTSRFSGFPGGIPGVPGGDTSRSRSGGNSDASDRARKQSKVSAVADPRTSSIIVTASKDMMVQISEMILQLDSSTAKKQKVFVYSLENAETQQVEQVLKELFESQNSRNSQSSQTKNALDTRANNSAQQQGTTTGNTSGFGGAGGTGGAVPR